MNSFSRVFSRQCKRDALLSLRNPKDLLQSLLFFIMMLFFFPMTLPFSINMLEQIAGGLIWIALLFAVLLASENLFQIAFQEGVIEQAFVSGYSIFPMV